MATYPTVSGVPTLARAEEELLRDLGTDGAAILRLVAAGAVPREEIARAKSLVFRRWSMEVLLLLRGAPMGFGELGRRLGGLRGESLSTRVASLERLGILERRVRHERPLRVEYRLSPRAIPLADTVGAMCLGWAEKVRAILEPQSRILFLPGMDPASPPAATLASLQERYESNCHRFIEARRRRSEGLAAEPALETARRFASLCVRRHDGNVMVSLTEGPLRFVELRTAIGAGDEALRKSLAHLEWLHCIVKTRERQYALQPMGLFSLALGSPVLVAAHRLGLGAMGGSAPGSVEARVAVAAS